MYRCRYSSNYYLCSMKEFDNSEVRRQDRLLDSSRAEELLQRGEYGILLMVERRDGEVAGYGVPMSYAWDGGDYIYFHCAPEGHKLECLDANPEVSFTIVGATKVVSDKFTTAYESVVVRGVAERNLEQNFRMRALELILDKYSLSDKEVGMKYAAKSFHRTEIIRIKITAITAKSKVVK